MSCSLYGAECSLFVGGADGIIVGGRVVGRLFVGGVDGCASVCCVGAKYTALWYRSGVVKLEPCPRVREANPASRLSSAS